MSSGSIRIISLQRIPVSNSNIIQKFIAEILQTHKKNTLSLMEEPQKKGCKNL